MKSNCYKRPGSFAETVQLVENYVNEEIAKESKNKQLFYHTLDHALAVKRRASRIFEAIEPTLKQSKTADELARLKSLMDLSAIAHDMVQVFVTNQEKLEPRRHPVGISETATADKLIEYIQNLNRQLSSYELDASFLFKDTDIDIVRDAILATICDRDPLAGKADYSFSTYSIYQPYLYDFRPKISIIGSIIALADLGALAMDGIKPYIQDGILIFIEDNLDLKDLILNGEITAYLPSQHPQGNNKIDLKVHGLNNPTTQLELNCLNSDCDLIKNRLITMTQFIVNLAKERFARLELEIAGFTPQARQILTQTIFTYLNTENIEKIEMIVPTDEETSLSELINFFHLYLNENI